MGIATEVHGVQPRPSVVSLEQKNGSRSTSAAWHCITGIMTQGRFGNGRGVEYTEAYKLNYWRPGMTDFVEYHDNIGRSVGLHHAFGLFLMKIAFS